VIKPQAARATSRGRDRYGDGGAEEIGRAAAVPRHRRRTAEVANSKAPVAIPGLENHYNEKQRQLLGMN
jgi:DNA-binding NtrC family response regulator